MRILLLFFLLATAVQAGKKKNKKSVMASVEGIDIDDEGQLASAMGVFGVNLYRDSDLAVDMSQPDSFGLTAKTMKSDSFRGTALETLIKYGFVEVAVEKTEEELDESDNLLGPDDIAESLRIYQTFYKLDVTGTMTAETIRLMSKDRCGVKDVSYEKPSRAKRYILSKNKWGTHKLTYWFDSEKMTADMPVEKVKEEIENALTMWADSAHVSFEEVSKKGQADIKISFEYGDHGDGYAFAGPGAVLAHAFYPFKGILHFDDAEDFTSGTVSGINLKFVALHEMGHVLGIKHSDVRAAVMYAYYPGYSDNLALQADDVEAAEATLGVGSGTVTPLDGSGPVVPTEPAVVTEVPDTPPSCIDKIDAAFKWDSSTPFVYLFAGAWYYRLKQKNPAGRNYLPVLDESAEPKRIGIDGFIGVPRNLDAAVENLENVNQFYAFKGNNYYLYDIAQRGVVESGVLSDLWPTNTPSSIDGGFKVNSYSMGFISGDKLYKYNTRTKSFSGGAAGSNYFNLQDGNIMNSLSITFYTKWTWIFQGAWYSVAKSNNGALSSSYAYRLIKNDIKLPMCDEGIGALTDTQTKVCKKELKKFKKQKSFVPQAMCKDYIAERYSGETAFDPKDFK